MRGRTPPRTRSVTPSHRVASSRRAMRRSDTRVLRSGRGMLTPGYFLALPCALFPSANLKGTEVQYFNLITKHKLEQNWTNCPSIAVHFPALSFSRGYFMILKTWVRKCQPDTIRENVVNIHEPSALFAHSPILEKIGFRLLASGGGESLNRGDFCGENSSLVSIRPGRYFRRHAGACGHLTTRRPGITQHARARARHASTAARRKDSQKVREHATHPPASPPHPHRPRGPFPR